MEEPDNILFNRAMGPGASMRITTLLWAVGIYSALLGAMMLIVPHRFEIVTYGTFRAHLMWWGIAFLLAGGSLLAGHIISLRWLTSLTRLAAGIVLLFLARSFAAEGAWVRAMSYAVLGMGTALGPLLSPPGAAGPTEPRRDLLALLIGLGTAVAGVQMIAWPDQFNAPGYDLIRTHLPWYGLAFIVTGLGLAYGQFRPASPRVVLWALHLAAGGALLVFTWMTAISRGSWPGVLYYGGFGALVAVLPWLEPAFRRINLSSLRTRLALVMIVAAAGPLIVAVSVVTDQEEQSAAAQALRLQQTIARTLADDISSFLSFHRAAAEGAAKAINLAQMTSDQQAALLRGLSQGYPSVSWFATYDEQGHLVARGDSPPPALIGGFPVFEQARRTNGTSFVYQVLPDSHRLFFEFGAPLRWFDNAWAGLLLVSVESTDVTSVIRQVGTEVKGQAYIVNDEGRLVAHQDPALNGSYLYVADSPPVAALLLKNSDAGVLKYWSADGQELAGFARVAGTGLGVVVERPLAVALAGVHAGREIAFTILMLMVGGAAVGGTIAAGALARPLEALAREAKRIGEDDVAATLPESGVAEVKDLSRTFGEMRARLAARTQERERAHEALREREARIRSIMDSTSDGFIFVGRDGRIKSLNQRATELVPLGGAWSAGGEFARAVSALEVSSEEREAVTAVLQSHLDGRDPTGAGDLEVRGLGRLLHWDAQPARDELGGAVGLTFTLRDVTQEREVSRMKSDFVSFATHQLRTPLAGIKWLLELAADSRDTGEIQAYIHDAREANERMVTLVNDLLDVSRLESGRLAVSLQKLDLGKMTQSVLEELGALIKEKGHRCSTSGVEGLPPVMADPQLIRQVVMNLLSNAIKYTPPPGEIALQMGSENGTVQWTIQDNGIGIPKNALPRVFEKFYRADNVHTVETEGTGLGLYLVRLIVERFGGRIWCESEEGKGSTFLFTVPVSGGKDTWTPPASGS